MFALFVILAVLAVVFAQNPAVPTLPAQYMVTNVNMVMNTNAGYPPHYTETDSAQYFDIELQMERYDVKSASYGTKGPYSTIYNYNQLFPVNCGGSYSDMQAPRAYQIVNGKCCYTNLVSDCPYKPVGNNPPPSVDTMYAPSLPKKVAYVGTVNSDSTDSIPAGASADYWQYVLYLNHTAPVFEEDFYFASSDHSTQLGEYLHMVVGPQFVNATTVYDGTWTLGAQDPSLFDVSGFDCSKQCSSSVSDHVRFRNLARRTANKH